MARRKAKLDLTLFPFLSVLSGLIAVNVLFMIVTISTRVISPEEQAEVAPPPKDGGQIGDPTKDVVPDGIDKISYDALESQIANVEKYLAGRREERRKIREEMLELASAIETKEAELEQAQRALPSVPQRGKAIGEPPRVRMIPAKDASGIQKEAVFIEVNSTGYTVHPEKKVFPVEMKKNLKGVDKVEIPEGLKTVLADIAKNSGKKYPLLLIHPSGAEAFMELSFYIRTTHRGMSLGWEPFSREWLLETGSK